MKDVEGPAARREIQGPAIWDPSQDKTPKIFVETVYDQLHLEITYF